MSNQRPKSMPPKPPLGDDVKFTFDYSKSDIKEIPSLTNLLSRKYLKTSNSSDQNVEEKKSNPPPFPTPQPPNLPIENNEKNIDKSQMSSGSGVNISDQSYEQSITGMMAEAAGTKSDVTESSTQGSVTQVPVAEPLGIDVSESVSTADEPVLQHSVNTEHGLSVKVQPAAKRMEKEAVSQLTLWEIKKLENGTDPLGKGLAQLFSHGVTSAVFLLIHPPKARGMAPEFLSTASVEAGHRLPLWTGLRWDPNLVPDLWNYFIKSGYVELTPPGTTTNQKSNRNTVRAAFGITQSEWLTLVRSGPVDSCRGVLALVSKNSVLQAVQEALQLISALPPKQ